VKVFQNLFPARGRKHARNAYKLGLFDMFSFSEPIPRKGTETLKSNRPTRWFWMLEFFRTYSPQGDGNNRSLGAFVDRYHLQSFSEPIPRKGTETGVVLNGWPKPIGQCFSEPIPRKGTETPPPHKRKLNLFLLFFRTYSPQGDGNC